MKVKMLFIFTFVAALFVQCASNLRNSSASNDANNSRVMSSSENPSSKKVTLKGKLVKKPWSKSIESYCAQGSDYYVLEAGNESHVIQLRKGSPIDLAGLSGKEVKLEGKIVKKTILDTSKPISQRPTGGDFTCTVFEVSKVL